jgi:hypothetical protein
VGRTRIELQRWRREDGAARACEDVRERGLRVGQVQAHRNYWV